MAASNKQFFVYDRRKSSTPESVISVGPKDDYLDLRTRIVKHYGITSGEQFVVCTTNREEVNKATFENLEGGETLYVLKNIDQELTGQTYQKVEYLPHYDTIIKSGMYEYYASEGQNPLPYAFAELIDNSLAATKNNVGSRKIELKLYLDDSSQQEKSTILVVDNGCGMTSWQLNNWAIYRLSKFNRKDKTLQHSDDSGAKDVPAHKPRFLNSEISYFGAGGKQAIFFIGNSTRMITKPKGSKDVHELVISKDEFEQREKEKGLIYSGNILNRKPGDASHINPEEEGLREAIMDEVNKDQFTCVVIWGISSEHVLFLKHNFSTWCSQLAHIYHYYLHGPNGNVATDVSSSRAPSPYCHIDIEVSLVMKSGQHKVANLRDIDTDQETLLIRSTSDRFDFKATVDGTRVVEGQLRYHPFLYDHESFPSEHPDQRGGVGTGHFDGEDEDELMANSAKPARGQRPIFECFWNGRLIPYTTIEEFDWCSVPKKARNIPLECFNRISGVLWTDDAFQVSTNKLTFMDLENKLREKNTIFARILNGQAVRASIEKHFVEWLQACHEHSDKQIMFESFQETISRRDTQRYKQYPWAVFNAIEWDGKHFKKGQLIRTQRTNPIIIGSIRRFLLYGDYNGSVCATGGEVEVQQEPRSLFDEVKIFPLAKLDRKVTDAQLQKIIEDEEGRLPTKLYVTWPEGDQLYPNEKRPAGKAIGDIKVEIQNKKGENVSKLPGYQNKRLSVEMKIIWHAASGDKIIAQYVCPYNKNWSYWFRRMENINNLGAHTLNLQAMLSDSTTAITSGKELPSFRIRFTVTEAAPDKFNVGYLEGPFRVGTPFQIPLDFLDKYGNSTKPSPGLEPELKANGLELSYEGVQAKGNSLIIKGIVAKGTVESNSGKSFTLTVKIPGLDENTQTLKIRLLPGPAHQLQVLPEIPDQLAFENGASPSFDLAVLDMAGNYTCEPKFVVSCKFQAPRQTGLPTYTADLSNSCKGTITGAPLTLRNVQKEEKVVARFDVQNFKNIEHVERVLTLLPSHQAASLCLSCTGEDGNEIELEHGRDLVWVAGEPITGLRFEVQDEIGKPIMLTNSLVSKMKLNWAADLAKDQVLAGRLPDINCPSSVKQTLFCHVSLNTGRVVDFAFTVKPKNGEPAILKVSCKGTTDVRIGEIHQSDILISLTDKFHNPIKKLHVKDLAELLIIADGIDYGDVVKSLDQSCGFHVKGLKFMDSSLGCKEVCFQWRGLKDYLRLNLVPGPPASLAYINYNPAEPVTVTPDGKLPKPLMVQLQDARGNPSSEANVKVVLGIDEAIKSIPPQQPVKTDSKGKASFGILTLALKAPVVPKPCEFNICSTNCRGLFTLGTKATIGRSIINGPVLKLHLTCDPEKPVELSVDYKGNKMFTVADELPETTVHVVAEDGNVMCSVLGKQLSMKLVRIDCVPKNHQKVFTASPVETTSANGYYHFRKVRVPEKSGEYNMQFHFNNGKHTIGSEIISLTVVPDSPVKLAPQQDPIIPSVSNQAKSSCRNLLKYLKLDLTDRFGNNTAMNVTGVLTLQVVSPDPAVKEVPYFEGNVNQYQVPISKGCAVVQNLQIQENTEGVDGFQYILRFMPKLHSKTVLPNYEVPFLFYNDASKQEEMAKLTRKRTELLKQLQTFEDLFQTTENIYTELEAVIRDAQTEESKFRGELRRLGFNSNFIKEEQNVGPALKICEQHKQALDNKSRRTYLPTPYPEEPGVLGKIGHLAWIEEDDVSAVVSWHMKGDMDVVVTETMEKAKDIYRKTNGKQQLIAVDSIFKRNTSKALPHVRNKSFIPTGNPKFALDYFIFRKDGETCRSVFANFIGDTIVLDTLDDATKYRTEVVKVCACPTLLTKTGERIASTGKFGGQQNKAPGLAHLQGSVFGEPPMKDLDRVQEQIQLLKKLAGSMKKQREARTELDKQKQKDTTFVMKKKDYEQLKKELAKVDEGIARLQNTGAEDERLPFPPVQDAVRNSPRRQSLPPYPASRYPPASPKTSNDSSVNGVSRRSRIPPAPATAPVERKRRRVT